jgi:hypothetical protein
MNAKLSKVLSKHAEFIDYAIKQGHSITLGDNYFRVRIEPPKLCKRCQKPRPRIQGRSLCTSCGQPEGGIK